MAAPRASIIIRTFNEARFLPALLAAIQCQTLRDVEIIVVDSGSFDGTVEIAKDAGCTVIEIESRDFTFGYSLNVGIEQARGADAVLVSAHTLPVGDQWLEAIVEPLADDGVAMVFGRQLGNDESKLAERRDFARTYGSAGEVLRAPDYFANNANSALRRELWAIHPFDVALPGLEDIAWVRHWMDDGYEVIYEPAAAVYHFHDESWPQVRRRYEREAAAATWIGIASWSSAPKVIGAELRSLAGDIWAARRCQRPAKRAVESILFRYWKLSGTLAGLWDASSMRDPRLRNRALFDREHRAVVIERAGRAQIKSVATPEVKPGDILVKVAYEGVCATDLEVFGAKLGYFAEGLSRFPIVPGHEFSGRVAATGSNVIDVEVGASVVVECIQSCGACRRCQRGRHMACERRAEIGVMRRDGGYAEYVVVPSRFVHTLPDGTDLLSACLCEPIAVALKGLGRVKPLLPHRGVARCAIVGLGPIGNIFAQLLRQEGHEVVGIDRHRPRRDSLESVSPAFATEGAICELDRFDLIVEATGRSGPLGTVLDESAAGAVILLLGLPYADGPFNFESIVAHDKIVVGSVGSTASDFVAAIETSPHLDLRPFTRHVVAFEDFELAWRACKEKRFLKTILEVDAALNTAPHASGPRASSTSRQVVSVT